MHAEIVHCRPSESGLQAKEGISKACCRASSIEPTDRDQLGLSMSLSFGRANSERFLVPSRDASLGATNQIDVAKILSAIATYLDQEELPQAYRALQPHPKEPRCVTFTYHWMYIVIRKQILGEHADSRMKMHDDGKDYTYKDQDRQRTHSVSYRAPSSRITTVEFDIISSKLHIIITRRQPSK